MRVPRPCIALVASCAAAGVLAQDAPAAPRDPADPRAQVPAVVHRSPFTDYRPFRTKDPASWKAVNDEVARIGGWKAYAREVYESQQKASAKDEAVPAAAPRHDGHGGK